MSPMTTALHKWRCKIADQPSLLYLFASLSISHRPADPCSTRMMDRLRAGAWQPCTWGSVPDAWYAGGTPARTTVALYGLSSVSCLAVHPFFNSISDPKLYGVCIWSQPCLGMFDSQFLIVQKRPQRCPSWIDVSIITVAWFLVSVASATLANPHAVRFAQWFQR